MICIKIVDYFGNELNENSIVQLIDENEEVYGETSEISIEHDIDRIAIKAFKTAYSAKLLYNHGDFKIVGKKETNKKEK